MSTNENWSDRPDKPYISYKDGTRPGVKYDIDTYPETHPHAKPTPKSTPTTQALSDRRFKIDLELYVPNRWYKGYRSKEDLNETNRVRKVIEVDKDVYDEFMIAAGGKREISAVLSSLMSWFIDLPTGPEHAEIMNNRRFFPMTPEVKAFDEKLDSIIHSPFFNLPQADLEIMLKTYRDLRILLDTIDSEGLAELIRLLPNLKALIETGKE